MPLVQIPVGIAPCQIDDFPLEIAEGEGKRPFDRSCDGALYLRPASTRVISNDELEFLQTAKQHKKIGARILVVRVDVVPDATRRPTGMRERMETPVTSQPVVSAPPAAYADSDDEG
jgi:hypothetical protein